MHRLRRDSCSAEKIGDHDDLKEKGWLPSRGEGRGVIDVITPDLWFVEERRILQEVSFYPRKKKGRAMKERRRRMRKKRYFLLRKGKHLR